MFLQSIAMVISAPKLYKQGNNGQKKDFYPWFRIDHTLPSNANLFLGQQYG